MYCVWENKEIIKGAKKRDVSFVDVLLLFVLETHDSCFKLDGFRIVADRLEVVRAVALDKSADSVMIVLGTIILQEKNQEQVLRQCM